MSLVKKVHPIYSVAFSKPKPEILKLVTVSQVPVMRVLSL